MKQKDSTVLYRKYRPYDWSEVIGQEHVVALLENSIKQEKIAHAYLFSGSRGIGKTSVARIFARSLGISENDIYEIDAASNRGIDDIREIREGVSVLPFDSKYKAYIIDEVHMLTKEAFNALLKTLEEPPSHALFMLATTETDKIPETVISRCQVFSFKKPTRDVLKEMVSKTAKKEGYTLEVGASDLIALLGDGSFRDTLGILQKVISTAGDDGKILVREVEEVVGSPKSVLVNEFIKTIAHKEKDKAISVILSVKEENVSMKVFIALVLEKLRMILLYKNAPSTVERLKEQVSEDDWKMIEDLVKDKDTFLNSAVLSVMLKAYSDTSKAYIDSIPLELATIDIC